MKVWFIGAGPGDPDLITVKAQRLIETCKVCLYAGSLVPEAIVASSPRCPPRVLIPECCRSSGTTCPCARPF